MGVQVIYRLHRMSVDWVAEKMGLSDASDAARIHAEARARAQVAAQRANQRRVRRHAPPRVLKRWQAMIGRAGRPTADRAS
jgi:hypothetical protein